MSDEDVAHEVHEEEAYSRPDGPLAPGLYLVATPIGNLEDMTLRGLRVLRNADRIACEDTRQTQKLLNHFAIKTPTVSYHLHNERGRAEELLGQLRGGARIAVVSDAGTPAIADPGEELVRVATAAGIAVFPVPGASAVLSALTASGLPAERFTFRGFLPSKPGERRSALEAVHAEMTAAAEPITQIFYETPHRIADALADVSAVFGPAHPVALARELTKLHEEFLRGTVADIHAKLTARDSIRGEMVLVLSGELAAADPAGRVSLGAAMKALMASGLDEKDALKQVAKDRGMGKSDAYREWQRQKSKR
jgi:16S rRNA (cytidine1402-2'-O)-methyltransferase